MARNLLYAGCLGVALAASLTTMPGVDWDRAFAQGAVTETRPVPQNDPRAAANPPNQGNGEQTLRNNSATRALDRAAGTNTSGSYPGQSDGTAANPPGTAASRALDRAAGTNSSGAHPQNGGNAGAPQGQSPAAPTTPGLNQQGTGHDSHSLGQNSGQGGGNTGTAPR